MSGYKNGKIYKITCETGKVYIGSTIKTLKKRLSIHKSRNECCTKDFINPKIELIETYPCKTKQELLWKEREWVEKSECVNVRLPITTPEERKEKNKEKLNEKITCECGAIISRVNKAAHLRTKKHLRLCSGTKHKSVIGF